MIRAIIFDFDGTLTELTLDFSAMRTELEKLVLRYVPAGVPEELKGHYMLEMIYGLETTLGTRGVTFRTEAFTLLRDMEVEAASGKELYPFARQVLAELKQMGVKTGIMTRNCTAAVRRIFPDLDEYVEAMVSRDDVALVKPHPSHPRALMGLLDVVPSEAALVGDHPTDIHAGLAAGLLAVGVLTGRIGRSELEAAGADFVVDDIRGILAIARSYIPESARAGVRGIGRSKRTPVAG